MTFAFIFESVGGTEWLLLLGVVLIVVGPKNLPSAARKMGQFMSTLRRAADEFKRQVMSMDQEVTKAVSDTSDTTSSSDSSSSSGTVKVSGTVYNLNWFKAKNNGIFKAIGLYKGYSATPYCNLVSPKGGQELVEETLKMLEEMK